MRNCLRELSKNMKINEIMLKLSSETIDSPDELSKYLIILTAHIWEYGKKTIEAEQLYARKWQELRLGLETDGQANIRIKTTEEYHDWKMAVVLEKTLVEMIRSIKKRLTSLTDELKSY